MASIETRLFPRTGVCPRDVQIAGLHAGRAKARICDFHPHSRTSSALLSSRRRSWFFVRVDHQDRREIERPAKHRAGRLAP